MKAYHHNWQNRFFKKPALWALALCLSFAPALLSQGPLADQAQAGEADVLKVKASKTGKRTYRFRVTVRHKDTGWDHYANSWQVVTPSGKVLATRVLAHPHVNEQPFTRSKGGIKIPANIDKVIVRAGDSVHGFGGKEVTVDLK